MSNSKRVQEAQRAFDAAIEEVGKAGKALIDAKKAYAAAREEARLLRQDLDFETAWAESARND